MKKHLLIVDDETAILRLLEFLLSKEYTVTLKSNGYEAIQWLEAGNRPDLIILDIEMPHFNGPDFFQSIKVSGLFSSIPVVILTGNPNTEAVQSRFRFPVDFIMKKPFNPEKLKNAIKSIVESSGLSERAVV